MRRRWWLVVASAALAGLAAHRHATASLPGCKGVEQGVTITTDSIVVEVQFDDLEQRVLTVGKLPAGPWELAIWSLPDGRLVARRDVRGVTTAALSSDGRQVAFVAGTQPARCMLWRPDRPGPLVHLGGSWGEMWNLCFSPDGSMVAAAGEHARACVWPTRPGAAELKLAAPGVSVPGPLFTPDARHLLVIGFNGLTRVFDLSRRAEVARWPDEAGVERPLSPAGDRFVGGVGPPRTVWEVPGGRVLSHLEPVPGRRTGLDIGFSRDGRSVVALLTEPPSRAFFDLLELKHHGLAVRWDAETGRLIGRTRLPLMDPAPLILRADLELARPTSGGLINTLSGKRMALPDRRQRGQTAFTRGGRWMAVWGWGATQVTLSRLRW